jgi:hypothetical protein
MASFSVSDVALTGFRIGREHPKAVAVWAGLQFVLSLTSGLAMITLFAPALATFAGLGANLSRGPASSSDPAAAMAAFQQMGPLFLFMALSALIFYPILYGAMNRAVLRPSDDRFGYLRIGADELRQLGLMLLLIGVAIVATIALSIALVAAFVPLGLMSGARTTAGTGSLIAASALTIMFLFAAFALWIYVWVRLSLASALTFATGKVNLFGSWTLTRGQFWPMFGAYLVAFILAIVVLLLTGVINIAVTAAAGGGFGASAAQQLTSVGAFLTPARIISLLVSSAANALIWPVTLTPPAAIYKTLPGSVSAIDTAAAFD